MSQHHEKQDYQYFLGIFADAVGCTGSPTMDEVLQRATEMKCFVQTLVNVYPGEALLIQKEARRILGYKDA